MKIEQIKITDITEADYNPRKISKEELQKLKNSISTFGIVEPILVNLNNMRIIGGHQRYNALLDIYYTENEFNPQLNLLRLNKDFGWIFPNNEKEIINEDYEKALNLALNKISGEWDNTKLKPLLEELQIADIELELTGFDEIELDDIKIEFPQEDNKSEAVQDKDEYLDVEEIPTDIEQGDIYQLGQHRLMCGNSLNEQDVKQLMQNEKAKILFTSPPYSNQRTYHTTEEELTVTKLKQFISTYKPYTNHQVINLGLQTINKEINCYWNEYIEYAQKIGYKFLSWNVWDKQTAGSIGNQKKFFPVCHEWIFIFGTEPYEINRTIPKTNPDRKERKRTRRRQQDGSLRITSTGDTNHPYKQMGTVISIMSEMGKIRSKHPATMPVKLPFEYIKAMTHENEIVIDCFGGSGTTLIACEQLNRQARLMELSPQYCQVIIDRWEEFTGEKAEKIN